MSNQAIYIASTILVANKGHRGISPSSKSVVHFSGKYVMMTTKLRVLLWACTFRFAMSSPIPRSCYCQLCFSIVQKLCEVAQLFQSFDVGLVVPPPDVGFQFSVELDEDNKI